MSQTIGVDIGGTSLRVARVTAEGGIEAALAEPVDRNPERLVGRLKALISAVDGPKVEAIGIGVPGRVDHAARAVLSGGFVDLSRVDLAARIERWADRPVVIENDATMALIAESRIGAAASYRHVVLLTLGTGIGGGVLVDGRVLRGRRGGGQLGHIGVAADGDACLCGRQGCLETFSSGTALRALLGTDARGREIQVEEVLEAAQAGDLAARAKLNRWIGPLRQALDSLAAIFDPEVIVLGGGLGDAAARALSATKPTSPWYSYELRPAALHGEAGVIGAALAARHEAMAL